ncbi:MAG: hypothetical protein ACREAU_00390, partial [Nitrosopumilaceae archaeon]
STILSPKRHGLSFKTEIQYYRNGLATGKYNNISLLQNQPWSEFDDRYGVLSFQGRVVEILGQWWMIQLYPEGIIDVSSNRYDNYENGIDFRFNKWNRKISVQCKTTLYKGTENEEANQFFYVRKNWLDCETCKATRILAIDIHTGFGFMIDREDLKKGVKNILNNEVWVSVEQIKEFNDSRVRDICIRSFDLDYLER